MKKNAIKRSIVLLGLSLLLTGCGKEKEAEPEIVGNDWRVTGAYIPGTLEHGETIDVLVGMGVDKLVIYYDEEVKEAYRTVIFPYETTDIQQTSESLIFSDLNEDGYTDLALAFFDQQGEEYGAQFIWDEESKDFNYIDISSANQIDYSSVNFIGAWLQEDQDMVIVVDFYYSWECIFDGEVTVKGTITVDNDKAILYTEEGNYYCELTRGDHEVVDEYDNTYVFAGAVEDYESSGIINFD